jgi:hypothetical protein
MKHISWKLSALIVAAFPFAGCSAGSAGDPVPTGTENRGPIGKEDSFGGHCATSSKLYCGGKSKGRCWCDEACTQYGDCCADYGDACAADTDPTGPGPEATDARTPELGNDLSVVQKSKISMSAALSAQTAPVIEAKFELDDSGKLSLSIYPLGKGLELDAERNSFQELAGDPTVIPFKGGLEVFHDQEHLTRSARDLTLVQLSKLTVADAVKQIPAGRFVYWAIPTVRDGRAGYGVYYLTSKNEQRYRFVDGGGSSESNAYDPEELGNGPGADATDERSPELGSDLSVVHQSKITMGQALDQTEVKYGPTIEAKFEVGDDGKLSLSIYPVKDTSLDAERSQFTELAGDPSVTPYSPSQSEFKVPDEEHLTRSSRDLTLVQTASLSLRDAVAVAEWAMPGGFVYWAIPTVRHTRAGYGVYVLGTDNQPHYFFIS